MTLHQTPPAETGVDAVIKLTLLDVGGQGGGVLTSWITVLAQRSGWRVQATSVAGAAQRTGSTIYYVEMAPDTGRAPIFALSPAPGDVDILLAAELMEAGRALNRGFVTPDRTTLIASTHRVLATVEKIVPGDSRADAAPLLDEARRLAHRAVCLDLEAMAQEAGSVISATLFGALAGSGALPFLPERYEETIRASGRGVEASLRAFRAGLAAAKGGTAGRGPVPELDRPASAPRPAPTVAAVPTGPERLLRRWHALEDRLGTLPEPVQPMARAGLVKVVDYQDLAYGETYLDMLSQLLGGDGAARGWRFSLAGAKHLANAMCYDDLIRVADLKTRATRRDRVSREQGLDEAALLQLTEYFHPRALEVSATLPRPLGAWLQVAPSRMAWLDRRVNRGRRLRSDRLRGFGLLWLIARLRPLRRHLLRHAQEQAHLRHWLEAALEMRRTNYDLAVEVSNCRRLIKGYSDTHARGLFKFDRVLSSLPMLATREDGADWLRRLVEAALADEKGTALEGAIATVKSFAVPA